MNQLSIYQPDNTLDGVSANDLSNYAVDPRSLRKNDMPISLIGEKQPEHLKWSA